MKNETPETPKKETLLLCTVIKVTTIGDLICGPGHQIKLTKEEAETLEKLGKVSIDGI